ncbi:MAG: ATPase [Sphingomonadaceae bacterium]|nr:ATPase [Sphingomonadaceae bacterium]
MPVVNYFQHLLGERGLAPHGFCLLWDPALIWTHVISDALIGGAYFSIPVAIAYFLTHRRDVAFGWVVWLFAAFIMACGATHFLSIWTLWHPDYGVEGLVKAVTAVVSVMTAIALWPLLPRAISLPSPGQLQAANTGLSLRIAERDAALAALHRETAERERAETMFRQSQKMEAVGQLTGGIAHDFNNLLTIVVANLDRIRRLTEDDPRLDRPVVNAIAGAERAAALTKQLLAFARRQPLIATECDLNAAVDDVRTLAGAAMNGIALDLDLSPDLWRVNVDINQIENALLNLVVNARDAMPGGGSLTIATANVSDAIGDCVEVAVIDTGAGMAPDVIAHAFEPFFTTKEVGHGTGLGLSQVYGFVTQSGGTVAIESELGRGTTVRIRLPRA